MLPTKANEDLLENVKTINHISMNHLTRSMYPCHHTVTYEDNNGVKQEKTVASDIIWKLMQKFNYMENQDDEDDERALLRGSLEEHFRKYGVFERFVPPPPKPPREDGIKCIDRIFTGCDNSTTPCKHHYTVVMHNGETLKKQDFSNKIAELIDDIGAPKRIDHKEMIDHFFKPNNMIYDIGKRRH